MADAGDVLLQLRDVRQDYGGLRPLRIKALDVRAGQRLAILGLDQGAGEVLVNLMTGSTAPRSGEVRAFGRVTTDIPDSDAWLAALRQYGLLGVRTVLIEQLTVEQNLAIPLTLDVDPLPDALRAQVRALGTEVGLAHALERRPAELGPLDLQRVRFGRALALGPRVLLAEHPTAPLDRADADQLARDMSRIVSSRAMAAVYITADRAFAQQAADEIVMLKPATGDLVSAVGWRRWFG
ncbi:MAG TPA: ATP-binding cassette domain-containing protein [Vicinamibacterales bacterium]|jgi:predicted ABC-type transport system involved in lysophospholipase L1 biosynthesis ATPase subunit|nr:ATP-binding cassette domain-containing protein [Vicinamibacterales bacterium]